MPGLQFRVELQLLSLESGARKGPIATGYRPDWAIGNTHAGKPTINGGEVMLEGREWLAPSEQCMARVEPMRPELWGRVHVGSVIAAQEGPKVVAVARVVSIDAPAYWTHEVAL